MRWIAGVVKRVRAVRAAAERLGRVKEAERAALAAAIDQESAEMTWPTGGWSRVVALPADRSLAAEGRSGVPHLSEVRAAVSGKRALFVSNRAAPEIVALLRTELGIECDDMAALGAPRRRQHLLERIRRGTYDIVLVAQGFAGHGDTGTIKEACHEVGAMNVLVGKGRLGQIVANLYRCILGGGNRRRVRASSMSRSSS
jgi:PII-like signaling protein